MDVESARPRHRLRAVAIWACVIALAAGVAFLVRDSWPRSEPSSGGPKAPKSTVAVARETLVEEISVKGRLDSGPDTPLAVPGTGMITWLAPEGGNVGRGDPLLRVNEVSVPALYGTVPMFRQLTVDAVGRDVAQLESNLRALGYDGFTVDQEFTDKTADAVESWQRSLGRPGTGMVEPGELIYVPGPIRVTRHLTRPGAMLLGADVLAYTSQDKSVTIEAELDKADWAEAGRAVTVALPGGKSVPGTVERISADSAAVPPVGAETAVAGQLNKLVVKVELRSQKAVKGYERTPVDVRYVVKERKDVLTVPVAALLALSEGGYGVEIIDAAAARVVAVEVGMITAAKVEVSAPGLAEGVLVSVAS